MMEQMMERLHNIAQDRYILNRSCVVNKLCALPWRRAEDKALGAAELGEACQTGLQHH